MTPPENTALPPGDEHLLLEWGEEEKLLPPDEEHLLLESWEDEKLLMPREEMPILSDLLSVRSEELSEDMTNTGIWEVTKEQEVVQAPLYETISSGVHETKTTHKTRLVWWILALILVAGIAYGAWVLFGSEKKIDFLYSLEQTWNENKYQDDQLSKAEKEQKELAEMNKAKNERNLDGCALIETLSRKDECRDTVLAIQATLSGNLDGCALITGTGMQNQCHDTIISNQALITENKELCTSLRDTSGVNYCQNSVDEILLKKMLETGTASDEKCQYLGTKYKESCLLSIVRTSSEDTLKQAVQNESIESCEQIPEDTLRWVCIDTILFKQALKENNPEKCINIVDIGKRTSCQSTLSTRNESQLLQRFVSEKSLDGCLSLTNTWLKNKCTDTVVLSTVRENGDILLCDKLSSPTLIDSCKSLSQ